MAEIDKLKTRLREYAEKSAKAKRIGRWDVLMFAVGWQQGEPLPLEIIDFIQHLCFDEGLIDV